jgi:hypothetical protein
LRRGRVVAETWTLCVSCRSPIGSAGELEDHLLLSRDLERMEASDYQRLSGEVVEVKRMLAWLLQKLRADSRSLTASVQ